MERFASVILGIAVCGLVLWCINMHYELLELRYDIRFARADVKHLTGMLKAHGEMVDTVVEVQQDTLRTIMGSQATGNDREAK